MTKLPKLIVADIDGTLTGKVIKELSSENKRAIEAIQKNKIIFGLASGRNIKMQLIYQYQKWHFKNNFDLLIGMNGAEYYDSISNEYVELETISTSDIKSILDLMRPFNLNPCIYKNDRRYCLRIDEDVERSFRKNGIPNYVVSEEELYKEPTAKIMFRIKEDRIDEVEKYAKLHKNGGYSIVKTQSNMLEFNPLNSSKGNALEHYCNKVGIDIEDVICFGDEENDISMLEKAGLGVCMINGSETTKKSADVITDKECEADGFADYIFKNILKGD